jgi:hypothetical protein
VPIADILALAGSLKFAEQNQDQHDNEDEAEPAAAVVTGPVKGAATQAAKAAYKPLALFDPNHIALQ